MIYISLRQYSDKTNLSYATAYSHFVRGMIPGAFKLETGTIRIPVESKDNVLNIPISEVMKKEEITVVYARVSSSQNRENLKTQSKRISDFCSAKGWIVNRIVEEVASGLNDERKKLLNILNDKSVTRIVVEHKDRLTRFGFNYISSLWDGEIIVINEANNDEDDLMQDFVSVITSFVARLYGKRRTKRNTEKLINELNSNKHMDSNEK